MQQFLIWWINQADCQAIGTELPEYFPAYLREEYASRYGRLVRLLKITPPKNSVLTGPKTRRLAGVLVVIMAVSSFTLITLVLSISCRE